MLYFGNPETGENHNPWATEKEMRCKVWKNALFRVKMNIKIPTLTDTIVSNKGRYYGCGGRTRTYDLRVMSPTSFQLLYSAIWALLECLYILTQRGRFVKYLFADTFPLKAPQPTALAIAILQKSNMVCSRG